MKIEIDIDALVLEGFDPADRDAIRDAVIGELSRLVRASAQAHVTPDHTTAREPASTANAGSAHRATPAAIGAQIARAVFGQVRATGHLRPVNASSARGMAATRQ